MSRVEKLISQSLEPASKGTTIPQTSAILLLKVAKRMILSGN
jgi:hypothetical protein